MSDPGPARTGGPQSPRPEGRLVLMPNTLDLGTGVEVALDTVLPHAVIARAAGLGHWVAENARSARALLKRVNAIVPLARALQAIEIRELPRPRKGAGAALPAAHELAPLLAPALAGDDIGLVSEAGMAAVADPGAALVAAAHDAGIAVEPLVGPTSLLLALAASGLNGQSFSFVGYLPVDAAARAARIRELESLSRRLGQTQIAIETPYRNAALLAALIEQLQPSTRLSVAAGLTLPQQRCVTRTVKAWRAAGAPISDRLPAVFLFLAS
jgi:16S rRNA (cytidine1402-2'-O)-methyltransferase